MAKILTPEQFRNCRRGTVFAFGEHTIFDEMLILDCFMGPYTNGGWGFYAINPMGIDAVNTDEMIDRMDDMKVNGTSHPACLTSIKYMDYCDGPMNHFLVYEKSDWDALNAFIKGD